MCVGIHANHDIRDVEMDAQRLHPAGVAVALCVYLDISNVVVGVGFYLRLQRATDQTPVHMTENGVGVNAELHVRSNAKDDSAGETRQLSTRTFWNNDM